MPGGKRPGDQGGPSTSPQPGGNKGVGEGERPHRNPPGSKQEFSGSPAQEPAYLAHQRDLNVANATQVSGYRMKEVFDVGVKHESTVAAIPDTLAYTAGVKNDLVTTSVAEEYMQFLAGAVGGENLSAFVSAELLSNTEMRENTIATLNALRGTTYGQHAIGRAPQPGQVHTDQELAELATQGPDAIQNLPIGDKVRMVGIADDLLKSMNALPDTGQQTAALQRAIAVGQTGDISIALSPEQIALLDKVRGEFNQLGGLRQTGESKPLAGIGIEQVSQKGGHLVVFNQEWTKAHPDEAFAAKLALEAEYPDLQVEMGANDRGIAGIPGWILNKFGTAVDYVSAPVGAGLQQFNEYGEQLFSSPEERARAGLEAKRLQEKLDNGEVPDAEVEETVRAIHNLQDHASVDIGMDQFGEQMFRNANPRNIGMGFADSYTKAMGVEPGDPAYGLMYGSAALLANIVADPTTYITGGLAGLRAARLAPEFKAAEGALASIPDIAEGLRLENPLLTAEQATAKAKQVAEVAGTTTEISRSWIRNSVYNQLAQTPEEIAVTKPYMKATDILWGVRERLGERRFAAFLATEFQGARGLGGDTEIAAYLAKAGSKEDLRWSLLRAQTGPNVDLPNLPQMESRYSDVLRQLDEDLAPGAIPMTPDAREALVSEAAWLKDSLGGKEWTRPMRQVFNSKQLKKMIARSKRLPTVEEDLIHAAMVSTEKTPDAILLSDNLTTHLATHPEVEVESRTLMQRWKDQWQPTGFGEQIIMPGTSPEARALRHTEMSVDDIVKRLRLANPDLNVVEARSAARKLAAERQVLADASEQSFEHVVSIGRTLGLPESRINELMQPWVAGELGSPSKNYHWLKDTWESMIGESPKLRASDKAELSQMWSSGVNERSPSYIKESLDGGHTVYEPTWYREVTDPQTEDTVKMGVPAFEADQFQTWRAPSMDKMHDYLSHVRRTELDWAKNGGWGKRAISRTHLGLAYGWQSFTNLWKTAVLGTRITALPARIVSEEMVRGAAMDASTLVWHPSEWFRSTKVGVSREVGQEVVSDFYLVGESPTRALGAAVNDVATNPSMRLARQGKETVTLTGAAPDEVAAFFRSYSDRMSRMFASPNARFAAKYMDHPEDALRAITKHDDVSWKAIVADTSHTEREAVERMQQTIRQSIGTGPGAEYLRVAMQRGAVVVGGETYRAGTVEFAGLLNKMYQEGDWVPGATQLARASGDYLPHARVVGAQFWHDFRDGVFGVIYSKPDLALARSPVWRQMAAREYRNLLRRGYNPDTALRLARSSAARGVSDLMFTIGAKTTGEHFLRNLMPFFPAYREIADTWGLRVPLRLGSGLGTGVTAWGLGSITLARRADVWLQAFESTGIIQRDQNGVPVVPIPGWGAITQLFTGQKADFSGQFDVKSLAGLFPAPTDLFTKDEQGEYLSWHERLRGILPSLGGTSALALSVLNKLPGIKGALDAVEDWTTLYGADTSLGPLSIDRLAEAADVYLPWMSNTTEDMHKGMKASAVMDGIRIAMGENPIPNWQTYDKDKDGYLTGDEQARFNKENTAYALDIVQKGERYATGLYVLKGFSSMLLPFSVQTTDDNKQKTAAMWALLNGVPDDNSFTSLVIKSVLADTPSLGPYMTRKTNDIRKGVVDPNESLDQFFDWVEKGKIQFRSPIDYTVFAMGMNSYSVYQSHLDALYEEAGQTPGEWMLNFDAKDQVAQEKAQWQHFLDASHDYDSSTGQTKSFDEMLQEYYKLKAEHEGEVNDLSLEQQRLLEFNGMMREYALKLAPGEASTENFYRLQDQAYDSLGEPTTELGRAVNWAFKNVFDPYYAKLDQLYGKLDTQNEWEKGQTYQDIRHWSNKYNREFTNKDHPEWGSFPSPEAYYFAKLDEGAQRRQVTHWADLPAEFLTAFQREQVGYSIPKGKQDAADKLADLAAEKSLALNKYVEAHQTSYSSLAVIAMQKKDDQELANKAKELGLAKYWKQAQAPEYQRIDMAHGYSKDNPSFDYVAGWADRLITAWDRAGVNLGGTTAEAKSVHIWMADQVRELRRQDQNFDSIMLDLSYALGDDGHPLGPDELVVKLFFDVFDTSHAYYLDKDKEK